MMAIGIVTDNTDGALIIHQVVKTKNINYGNTIRKRTAHQS